MKAFVVLALVACATASPGLIYSGYHGLALAPAARTVLTHAPAITYAAPAAVVAPHHASQYHAQDELGQASYGYAHPGQAHSAVRDAFGNVAGSYAYINAEGKEVRVSYVADAVNGFRVVSNDLPVAPSAPEAPKLEGPAPVEDTPEVAEAKRAHAKAVEEAIARNAEAEKADAAKPADESDKPQSRKKRGIYAAAPVTYASPVTYARPVAIASPALVAHAPVLRYF